MWAQAASVPHMSNKARKRWYREWSKRAMKAAKNALLTWNGMAMSTAGLQKKFKQYYGGGASEGFAGGS